MSHGPTQRSFHFPRIASLFLGVLPLPTRPRNVPESSVKTRESQPPAAQQPGVVTLSMAGPLAEAKRRDALRIARSEEADPQEPALLGVLTALRQLTAGHS